MIRQGKHRVSFPPERDPTDATGPASAIRGQVGVVLTRDGATIGLPPAAARFPSGGGETGALIRAHDWTKTSIGDPAIWPVAIKSALATMLTSPRSMFMVWGPELTFFFNDAYRPILHARLEGAVGRPFAELWSDIWPMIGPIVMKAIGGEGCEFENWPLTLTRNGYPESTWWNFAYTPLRDERSVILGMLCNVTETTSQVMAQTALGDSEARQTFRTELDDALRSAPNPKAVRAIAAERLGRHLQTGCVGYSSVDLNGDHVVVEEDWSNNGTHSVVGTHRLADFGPDMIAALQAGCTVKVNDTATDPLTSGSIFQPTYADIGTRAFIDAPLIKHGRLAGVLFVLDPKPRIWTDSETTLVEEVAQWTWASLQRMQAEDALRQAQKMEAVGQLTGGIAHDFNNLLTAIMGSMELLRSRIEQGRMNDIDRYIALAESAGRQAAGLTHRLLAFSRRQTLDPRTTDVNALVAGMDELIRRTVGPEITVEVISGDALWKTLIDQNQLENALLNLSINARDAMPDGGLLTIETSNRRLDEYAARQHGLPPGPYVWLSVSDTGSGMTPEVIRRAFDPFFTTKPIGQGTGLGLSMIYGFAQQSGGHAQIDSEPGRGTMVSLYLPAHHDDAPHAAVPAALAAPGRTERGETVLVVDDEPSVRMLVIQALEDLGYTAMEAADGTAALNMLRSGVRIDLLITDVGLPGGLNGRQMADAARVVRPGLKILFITGYAENAAMQNGILDSGMQVLTKPFALETLAHRVKDMIAGS